MKSTLSVRYVHIAATRLSLPCEHKAVTLCSPYKRPSSKLSVYFPSSEPPPAPCSPFLLTHVQLQSSFRSHINTRASLVVAQIRKAFLS